MGEARFAALREAVERLRAAAGGPAPGEPGAHEIDVGALMGAAHPPASARPEGLEPAPGPWPRFALPRAGWAAPALPVRPEYALHELLAYHDVDFVVNAYRALLHRNPDPAGLAHHVARLHDGASSKIELLQSLRKSAEGRAVATRVRGMRTAVAVRALQRIPVLGALVSIALYVVRMPVIVRNVERNEVQLHRREREVRSALDAMAEALEAAEAAHRERIDGVDQLAARHARLLSGIFFELWRLRATLESGPREADLVRLADGALDAVRELEAGRAALERGLEAERGRVDSLAAAKADAAEVRAAIERLDAVKANEQAVATFFADNFTRERIEAVLRTGGSGLEDFYVAFEERFRGSRDDIRRLVAVHLPVVQAANAGDALSPVIDVGCGRGEWLEVLRDKGLAARGVDLNGTMARQCRERGLEVVERDAIEYLRDQPEGSLGAVTAMHVIEHLPFERLVELFDESHRALRPGGVVIFETPNPENLQVGACNFWYDPTHVRPIPPLAAQFIAEARGFARTEIVRLHPYPIEHHPQSGDAELRDRLVRFLYGPQDYAIVAWKA